MPASGVISVPFNIQASNTIQTSKITVKACGSSQFSTNIVCDNEVTSISIISKDSEPSEFCGDNICQDFETSSTCPLDCEGVVENIAKTECIEKSIKQPWMGWTWVEASTTKGKGPFGIGSLIGLEETTVTGECKPQFLIYWIIGGLSVLILIFIFIVLLRRPNKIKRRKK